MFSRMDGSHFGSVFTHGAVVRKLRKLRFGAISAAGLLGMAVGASVPAHAQLKARVDVDATKPLATLYTTSIGIAADRWDAKAYDDATVKLLQDAGITNLRFPGNNGIDSLYHWSTGELANPYTNDRLPAFATGRKLPGGLSVIETLGSGLITVNYGTNPDASGPGEPVEAAAWVAYVNGKSDDTKALGKDSKGNDWKTVGYWATMRGSAPLDKDDGYNALRLNHSEPYGIQLWTIGNEPWGNGYYDQAKTVGSDADSAGLHGQSGSPEADLHAGKVNNAHDWGRHAQNSKVGPAVYGAAVVEFAKAMKAVDPTVMIGAFLIRPPISGDAIAFGKGWNAGVLKAACGSMDFSAVTFWEGKGDTKNQDFLDESDLLQFERYEVDQTKMYDLDSIHHDYVFFAGDIQQNYKKFCPANHAPQLAVTSLGIAPWLTFRSPAAVSVYAAEAMSMLLESGVYTVEWGNVHAASPSFLDNDNNPQPAFYGIKMLHEMAIPGDTFVSTHASIETINAHAVKRRDGGLGLILINKNADRVVSVTVSLPGFNYATKGTRYDWGKAEADAKKGVTETPIANLGSTFTVDVPRYGVTSIVIPKAE